MFCFSSRRRHTRLTCDWSSDVCSSDLSTPSSTPRIQANIAVPLHRGFAEILGVLLGVDAWKCGPSLADMDLEGSPDTVRSEERRVGKGWRARGSPGRSRKQRSGRSLVG